MKNFTTKLVLATCLLPIITACAPTATVIHLPGGMHSVMATAPNEDQANQLVGDKAKSICTQQQGRINVIDKETRYQGVDKDQQQLINFAHKILPSNKETTPYSPLDHEYKTTLVFRCE